MGGKSFQLSISGVRLLLPPREPASEPCEISWRALRDWFVLTFLLPCTKVDPCCEVDKLFLLLPFLPSLELDNSWWPLTFSPPSPSPSVASSKRRKMQLCRRSRKDDSSSSSSSAIAVRLTCNQCINAVAFSAALQCTSPVSNSGCTTLPMAFVALHVYIYRVRGSAPSLPVSRCIAPTATYVMHV